MIAAASSGLWPINKPCEIHNKCDAYVINRAIHLYTCMNLLGQKGEAGVEYIYNNWVRDKSGCAIQ